MAFKPGTWFKCGSASCGKIELGVTDGNILPHLKMAGAEERCVFSGWKRKVSIHSFRPGFCRLVPLGRYYEDGGFKYILQIHECKKTSRSKIKVRKWVDTPVSKTTKNLSVTGYFLLDVQEVLYESEDSDLIRNLNMYVVNQFYRKPYDGNRDFYEQFYERLAAGKELLSLWE